MADKKLQRNGEGKLEVVEEKEAVSVGSASATSGLSFFEDDEGENLWSKTILLDGKKVMVRELSAAEMTAYTQGEKRVSELMVELGSAADSEGIERLSGEIKTLQASIYDRVMVMGVGDWELTRPDGTPVPCTPEMKKKLLLSKKAEIADKIVQLSSVGRDLSGFLGT